MQFYSIKSIQLQLTQQLVKKGLENGLQAFVNTEVQNIIKGVVLLAAIVLDNWLHPRDEETARQGD